MKPGIGRERRQTNGLREPPEGVLAGENVPVENDQHEIEEGLVDELVPVLKERPGYASKSDSELREIALEILEEHGDVN